MRRETSQRQRILELLRARPDGITAMDALHIVGSMRLASRIHELRLAGYTITTEHERHEGGTHARYRLQLEGVQLEAPWA